MCTTNTFYWTNKLNHKNFDKVQALTYNAPNFAMFIPNSGYYLLFLIFWLQFNLILPMCSFMISCWEHGKYYKRGNLKVNSSNLIDREFWYFDIFICRKSICFCIHLNYFEPDKNRKWKKEEKQHLLTNSVNLSSHLVSYFFIGNIISLKRYFLNGLHMWYFAFLTYIVQCFAVECFNNYLFLSIYRRIYIANTIYKCVITINARLAY